MARSSVAGDHRKPLEWLNFFMADMQAGIGPFLGIFLLAHGWQSGWIGTVMTIGGVAGMLMTIPAGALIDASDRKRIFVIVPGICTVVASCLILVSQEFWVVAASQVATAIAGAAIMPAVIAITLGIVKREGFSDQNGRNQAFNHAGNMVGAGLSGLLGWQFGYVWIFVLAAAFGLASIATVLLIPREAIDNQAARGMKEGGKDDKASGIKTLLECKPLLILAACLAFFHLGNGAMLPLYGLAVTAAKGDGGGSLFVASTVVVAQAIMIGTALLAMRMGGRKTGGYWLVMLVSFIALPVRGLIAAHLIKTWGVFPVQMLDGIGAGLQSVAVPALVQRILDGTGRVNVGQGAVMTVQGVGASLSPAIGGWLAQDLGYPTAFTILGAFAIGSIVLWTVFAGTIRQATGGAAKPAGAGPAPAPA
ncbi:MFS transporter [Aureimonas endophytica]|nr:MFS transporter [Aureimonas endophytica]